MAGCLLAWMAGAAQVPGEEGLYFLEAAAVRLEDSQGLPEELEPPSWLRDLMEAEGDPLDLNAAGRDELEALPGMTDMLAFNVVAYRETYGDLVSLYELQAIEGFDLRLIRRILPYVRIAGGGPTVPLKARQLLVSGRHEFLVRVQRVLETRKGYRDDPGPGAAGGYAGSPGRVLVRYRYAVRDRIRLGLTMEKDPGEPFWSGPVIRSMAGRDHARYARGFDHYSGFLQLRGMGLLENLVVGDYQAVAGQGLIFGSGRTFGTVTASDMARSRIQVLAPHGGTDENGFLRGAAATLAWGKTRLTLLYSSSRTDARLDTLSSSGLIVASPTLTGLHRTMSELSGKDALRTRIIGGRIARTTNRLRAGISLSSVDRNHGLAAGDDPEDLYRRGGAHHFAAGIDYHFIVRNGSLFGEVAMDGRGAVARLHGLSLLLRPGLRFGVLYRDYSPAFDSPLGNAFAAGETRNEKGFLASLSLQLPGRVTLHVRMDQCRFPWLRYRRDRPGREREMVIMAEKEVRGTGAFHVRVRVRDHQVNGTVQPAYTAALVDVRKISFQAASRLDISPSLALKSRLEYVVRRQSAGTAGTGFLTSHDLKWKSRNGRVTVDLRCALFDTDTFEERIYAFEPDVRYALSLPAHYFKGLRAVAVVRLSMLDGVGLWIRTGRTLYFNRDSIGSGRDEIPGSAITEVKVQLMVQIK